LKKGKTKANQNRIESFFGAPKVVPNQKKVNHDNNIDDDYDDDNDDR